MKPELLQPSDLDRDVGPDLSSFGWRMLAEGDSWFSISTLLPGNSNLLFELDLARSTAIVNCAAPGATLQRMVDRRADRTCWRLLRGRTARHWDAVLLSGGGNDLIAAAGTPLDAGPGGGLTPLTHRVLRTAAEVGSAAAAEDWISEPGWAVLAGHLLDEFHHFVRWRNAGPSASRPLLLHTYATPVARPAGELGRPDGWLYPALQACGIPRAWHQPVTQLLFNRLRALLRSLDADSGSPQATPRVHVFDSAAVPLVQASPDARGPSGDWVNEIHLTPAGWRKLARPFGAWIGQVLARYG